MADTTLAMLEASVVAAIMAIGRTPVAQEEAQPIRQMLWV
jgi:hypothetical protein